MKLTEAIAQKLKIPKGAKRRVDEKIDVLNTLHDLNMVTSLIMNACLFTGQREILPERIERAKLCVRWIEALPDSHHTAGYTSAREGMCAVYKLILKAERIIIRKDDAWVDYFLGYAVLAKIMLIVAEITQQIINLPIDNEYYQKHKPVKSRHPEIHLPKVKQSSGLPNQSTYTVCDHEYYEE